MSRADFFPGLDDEANRMAWAVDYLPVPHVIEHGSDAGVSWLITHPLPGRDATDSALVRDPLNASWSFSPRDFADSIMLR